MEIKKICTHGSLLYLNQIQKQLATDDQNRYLTMLHAGRLKSSYRADAISHALVLCVLIAFGESPVPCKIALFGC